MRMDNARSTLVGEEIEGRGAFYGSVAAPNGSIAFLSKLVE